MGRGAAVAKAPVSGEAGGTSWRAPGPRDIELLQRLQTPDSRMGPMSLPARAPRGEVPLSSQELDHDRDVALGLPLPLRQAIAGHGNACPSVSSLRHRLITYSSLLLPTPSSEPGILIISVART